MVDRIEIQNAIDKYPYVDARVKKLNCEYFGDEVTLIYENNEKYDIGCYFYEFFRVVFNHVLGFDKMRPVKDMSYGQMPYFVFDIAITDSILEKEKFLSCKLDLGLLELEILCKDIEFERIPYLETDGKVCSEF